MSETPEKEPLDIELELDAIWHSLKAHVPNDDPLKADIGEYLLAGEWGSAAEAMAILAKRYRQEDTIMPRLEPVMMQMIMTENEQEEEQAGN